MSKVTTLPALAALLCAPGLAAAIEVFRAQDVQPYRAPDVQADRAQEVRPDRAREVQPGRPAAAREPEIVELQAPPAASGPAQGAHPAAEARPPAREEADLSYFFRVWRTRIPGAVWQSPSATPGWDVLHVSAGAQAGDLTIFPDGRYVWNSYGGKKGRWVREGGAIVLVDTVEGKRWSVRRDPDRQGGRDIVVWDGSVWYDGRK